MLRRGETTQIEMVSCNTIWIFLSCREGEHKLLLQSRGAGLHGMTDLV